MQRLWTMGSATFCVKASSAAGDGLVPSPETAVIIDRPEYGIQGLVKVHVRVQAATRIQQVEAIVFDECVVDVERKR